MKAYKALKHDNGGYYTDGMGSGKKIYWTEGMEFKTKGAPRLCKSGIHCFEYACFAINYFESNTHSIAECEVLGEIDKDTFKLCTNHIKIIRIVTQQKIIDGLDGDFNSGNSNSGVCNSGDYNSGHCNSGDFNSGNGYINYFCTKQRYFLFDAEVESIPPAIKNMDMSWFNLDGKTYQEAWQACPHELRETLKNLKEINDNKEKFIEIAGLNLWNTEAEK